MAYDPMNPNGDEKDAQSKYADLMAPPPGVTAAPMAGQAPVANHPVARAGFVNFDRYQNANKATVDRMRSDYVNNDQSNYAALTQGLSEAQKGIQSEADKNAAKGPGAAGDTIIGANSVEAAQKAALGGLNGVSRDQALANANAKYAGPSQGDVDSKYGALMADYQAKKNSESTGRTAFDRQLVGPMGSALQNFGNDYKNAYGMSSKVVGDASAAAGNTSSQWRSLLDKYDNVDAPAEAAANKARDDKNRTEGWNNTVKSAAEGVSGNGAWDGHRPSGEEAMNIMMGPAKLLTGKSFIETKAGITAQDRGMMAQVMDKLSDDQLKAVMRINAGKDPEQFVNVMRHWAGLMGIPLVAVRNGQ